MTAAQKKYLKDAAGLSDQEITEREAALASKEKEVEEEGVERKDGGKLPEEEKEETLPPQTKELVEAIGALTGIIKEMHSEVQTLKVEVKQLKLSDAEKVAEKQRMTPALSMAELIKGIVYESEDAEITKQSPLLKGKPKIKKLAKQSNGYANTGVGFLDNLLSDEE